jgi:hypothetical protein
MNTISSRRIAPELREFKRTVIILFKPFLTPEEIEIYLGLDKNTVGEIIDEIFGEKHFLKYRYGQKMKYFRRSRIMDVTQPVLTIQSAISKIIDMKRAYVDFVDFNGEYNEIIKAIKEVAIIPFKPYLTNQEVMIYMNRSSSTVHQMLSEYGIYKSETGHYRREHIDEMLAGEPSLIQRKAAKIKI